jgi:hypothetical protein
LRDQVSHPYKQQLKSVIRALMIKAVRTSETSVYFNGTTRRNIPEGCHIQFIS